MSDLESPAGTQEIDCDGDGRQGEPVSLAVIRAAIATERRTRQPLVGPSTGDGNRAERDPPRHRTDPVIDNPDLFRLGDRHEQRPAGDQPAPSSPGPLTMAADPPGGGRLGAIPILGKLLWWVHALLKAPSRIRDLNGFRLQASRDRRALADDLAGQVRRIDARIGRLATDLAERARQAAEAVTWVAERVESVESRTLENVARLDRLAAALESVDERLRGLHDAAQDHESRLDALLTQAGSTAAEAAALRRQLDGFADSAASQRRLADEQQEALRAQARKIAAHGETLGRQEADLQRQDVTLRQQAIAMGEAQGRVAAQQEALHEQAAQLQTLRVLVERLQDAARAGEKTWQQASQDLAARQQAAIEATQAALEQIRQRLGVPGVQPSGLDRFYRDLEERFRGPFDLIKERQKRYLPVVARARAGSTSRPVLDLGCGRGEWLQILAENGLVARGIDRNKAVLASCRQLGLAVEAVDLFDYLEKLPDASVGAVTAFHVLEHLPFEQIMQLLHETARVLAAGGVGIFETPNPANLGVASYSFHFDPSHLTVLPGPLLQFMAEHQGLSHIEVEEIHPVARPDSGGPVHRLVSGPQDQVVIGWSERPEPR